MTINNFIHKYTSLCDKNHHLLIHFGNLKYENCFNNNLTVGQITKIINYLDEHKYPIINNENGEIAIYHNEYFNITNNNITEYTIIDSILDKDILIKFTQINKNKNVTSFNNNPNNKYDYELVVSQLDEGCNIEILKKYNNNNSITYNLIISVYKPCDITKYIDDIIKIIK
jgi:hypothetical protein